MVGRQEEFINLAEKQGLTVEEAIKQLKIMENPDNIKKKDLLSEETQPNDLPYFTQTAHPKFVPMWMAIDLCNDLHFATHEPSNTIYVYNNGIYEPRGEKVIQTECQKRLGRFVKNNYINETVECIRRETYTPPEKFDNPSDGIVVINGLLNLKTKKLQKPSPEYIHLSKINAKYDPKAKCPKILNFINEIVNESDVALIQEMFGYCLLKDYPFAKAFMLLGGGSNGKSTLIDLLELFLGKENIATPSLQELLENRFAKISLYGKLANLHADLSSKKLQSTGTFKMLTGGDTIYGERKFQDPIEFKNYAKLIYSANELPRTNDRTTAFWRRWVVVDFPNEFPENDEGTDPNLPYSIATEEELSGLLNWALEGLDRLLENNHFSHTTSRNEIEKKWVMETDSLRAFLNMVCEVKLDGYVVKEDLYDAYKEFCADNNLYVVKKGEATKKIPSILPRVDLFRPEVDGKQKRCWRNLVIKPEYLKEGKKCKADFTCRQEIPGETHTLYTYRAERSNNNKIIDIYPDISSINDKIHEILKKTPKTYFETEEIILNENSKIEPDHINKIFMEMKNKGEIMINPTGKYTVVDK